MIRGEEELVELNKFYDNKIHSVFKKFPIKGKFILMQVVLMFLQVYVLLMVEF